MPNQIRRTPSETLIRDIIAKIAVGPNRGKDISKLEAYHATTHLLNGELNETQAAIFLIGLRMKKESMMEYAGILKALQENTTQVDINLSNLVYIAEPYDGYSRTNPITPYIPAVLASCDVPCLMQGVHSIGPKFGVTAHQIYAANNIATNLTPEKACQKLLNKNCGWAYLDQAQSNPLLFALKEFRDTIVKRTALTTLERLSLPIKAKSNFLALGYVHSAYPPIYAEMSLRAGFDRSLFIKGLEGGVCPAMNKPLRSYEFIDKKLFPKNVDATPIELMNLSESPQTKKPFQTIDLSDPANLRNVHLSSVHLSNIISQPKSLSYQQLISTSAFIVSKNKSIHLDRAALLVKAALDGGEAESRFSALKASLAN